MPVKAADRVKADRRDTTMSAKLHRACELTAVWVPYAAHRAMRDLIRARGAAMRVTANFGCKRSRSWGQSTELWRRLLVSGVPYALSVSGRNASAGRNMPCPRDRKMTARPKNCAAPDHGPGLPVPRRCGAGRASESCVCRPCLVPANRTSGSRKMVRNARGNALTDWLAEAEGSMIAAFSPRSSERLARRLRCAKRALAERAYQ